MIDGVIAKLAISESEQAITIKNGQSRIKNQIQWARFYLARAGYLDKSERGIWSLTERGMEDRGSIHPQTIIRQVNEALHANPKTRQPKNDINNYLDADDDKEKDIISYREKLMTLLYSLPPNGFERLCQRILRESDFQEVVVTGRSGDGGIDGIGVLQINPFVSFNVLFQCKRYKGSVTPSQIRDFRGAMMGRADKGIVITTGTFTLEAKREARRDGVPPIELVDGDTLISMLERLKLGLTPITTYEIDENFFDDYMK